jgi:hypothetical protein
LQFSFESFKLVFKSISFGQKITLSLSLLLTIIGSMALSFGPQEIFGFTLSYILLATGRFLIAFGSHGISVNGYLLSNKNSSHQTSNTFKPLNIKNPLQSDGVYREKQEKILRIDV